MFGHDSAEPDDPALAQLDLAALLPPASELSGWVIVCQGFAASDETAENLTLARAEAVSDMLVSGLGISSEQVRVMSAEPGTGNQRYRQRVDVYFLHTGNK